MAQPQDFHIYYKKFETMDLSYYGLYCTSCRKWIQSASKLGAIANVRARHHKDYHQTMKLGQDRGKQEGPEGFFNDKGVPFLPTRQTTQSTRRHSAPSTSTNSDPLLIPMETPDKHHCVPTEDAAATEEDTGKLLLRLMPDVAAILNTPPKVEDSQADDDSRKSLVMIEGWHKLADEAEQRARKQEHEAKKIMEQAAKSRQAAELFRSLASAKEAHIKEQEANEYNARLALEFTKKTMEIALRLYDESALEYEVASLRNEEAVDDLCKLLC